MDAGHVDEHPQHGAHAIQFKLNGLDINRKPAAVLAQHGDVLGQWPLALGNAPEHRRNAAHFFGGVDKGRCFAQQLFAGVAQHAAELIVDQVKLPGCNVCGHHACGYFVEDGVEPAFGCHQCRLLGIALGDVTEHAHLVRLSVPLIASPAADLHGYVASIGMANQRFVQLGTRGVGIHPLLEFVWLGGVYLRRVQLGEVQAHQLRHRATEQRGGLGVGAHHGAGGIVGHHHRIGYRLEQRLKALQVVALGLFGPLAQQGGGDQVGHQAQPGQVVVAPGAGCAHGIQGHEAQQGLVGQERHGAHRLGAALAQQPRGGGGLGGHAVGAVNADVPHVLKLCEPPLRVRVHVAAVDVLCQLLNAPAAPAVGAQPPLPRGIDLEHQCPVHPQCFAGVRQQGVECRVNLAVRGGQQLPGQLGGQLLAVALLLNAAHGLLGLNAGMALVHQAQCLRRDFAVHVQHGLDQGGGGPLHFCVSPLVGLGQWQAVFHGLGRFGHAFVAVQNVKGQPAAEVAEQIIQHFLKRALARLQIGNVFEKRPVALLVAVQVRVLTKGCEPHRFFGAEVVLGIVGQFAQNLACLRFGRSVNELLCHAVEQRHQCAVLGIHHVDAGFKVGIPGEDFKPGLASGGGCGVGGVGGRQCHDSVAGNGQTDIHSSGPL